MARPLRIEYPGALYHITSRGNEQKEIYRDGRDHEKFLSFLASAVERHGAVIHAWCLMTNHYHLVVETPEGNLSRIMKHINSSYTGYFNTKWNRAGHLLQGRYKAILVEADAYACELCRYISLNPVRAKMVESPEKYRWSSYRDYIQGTEPSWLTTAFILGYFGTKEGEARSSFSSYVHELIGREYSSPLLRTVASCILGTEGFVSEIREKRLDGKESDRDLPALRELVRMTVPEGIRKTVNSFFPGNGRLGRMAGIFLCHRFSGAKLKEIGAIYGLSESGVSQASRRFEKAMEEDEDLRGKIERIKEELSLSNV